MVVTEYTVKADIANPVRFAFLSDLHDSENGPLIKAIRRARVDAVLVGGDFIHNDELCERGFEFLRLSAKLLPTFCSIGNHERRYKGDLLARMNETGVAVLDNRAVAFRGVRIGGLSTGYTAENHQSHWDRTPAPNLDFLEEFSSLRGFKLLLSHHPEYYPRYIREKSIDLTLSGHAHGGQWRFFGRGIYSPGQGIFPKYTSGMHEGRFIVSRGLSTLGWIPRINNKPEMLVINLIPRG
ncbi:MAG: metallophosphoesterase [Clostridia bacterium]|nr:metallophosphoesterase [Clostridia bacterium]